MQLFRGDKITNDNTKPGWYRNNGLRSKAFGSGCNPENIELLGLLKTIRKHIHPVDQIDLNYYDVTDFLSFSEERERAMYWCTYKDTLIINKAKNYEETRYLFILELDNKDVRKITEGIYLYRYKCNPSLSESDSGKEPHLTNFRLMYDKIICPICNNIYKKHYLILINTVEYLTANKNQKKLDGAIEAAAKDREWLILPLDLIDKKYRSSRIPRSKIWFPELYKVIGEKRPKSNCL